MPPEVEELEAVDQEVEVLEDQVDESQDDDSEAEDKEELESSTEEVKSEEGGEEAAESEEDDEEAEIEDEVQVSIGEPAEEEAPNNNEKTHLVKHLRKNIKGKDKELRETKRQLEELKARHEPAKKKLELRKEPTLEDHDYDADAFKAAFRGYLTEKTEVEAENAKLKTAQEDEAKAWQSKRDGYNKSKTSLKVSDFEDAEDVVLQSLNDAQQSVILQASKNPALLVYALGKSPERVKELAKIGDHVTFAWEVAKIETELKVTKKRSKPAPEGKVSGTGQPSGTLDTHLDKLRKEAEKSKTRDFSKVTAYKRANR